MRRRNRKVVGAVAVALLVGAAVPAVVVATTTTIITSDATAVGVKVGSKLGLNSSVQFTATIGFVTVSSTCTTSAWSFVATTQDGGLGPFPLSTYNTAA